MDIKQGLHIKCTQKYQAKLLFHILCFRSRADIISSYHKYIDIGDNLWVRPKSMER